MDNRDEVKLPDFLNDLIRAEKSEGIVKLDSSGFEKKIYNRIHKEKSGLNIFYRNILSPVSLSIAILIITLILINGPGKEHETGNPILFALESITTNTEIFVNKPKELENIKTIFEDSLKQVLYSANRKNITLEELKENIANTIDSIADEESEQFTGSEKIISNDLIIIKEGVLDMNKKNDYSELFSRIINNITEV